LDCWTYSLFVADLLGLTEEEQEKRMALPGVKAHLLWETFLPGGRPLEASSRDFDADGRGEALHHHPGGRTIDDYGWAQNGLLSTAVLRQRRVMLRQYHIQKMLAHRCERNLTADGCRVARWSWPFHAGLDA
jgi:hypothetical protein